MFQSDSSRNTQSGAINSVLDSDSALWPSHLSSNNESF